MKRIFAFFACLCLTLGCTACGKNDSGKKQPNAGSNPEAPGRLAALTVGIMPAVDAAPLLVAESEGLFKESGLVVNLLPFNNATDRQSALQSGTLDGTITDIIALIHNVANGFGIKATACTDGVFPILAKNDPDRSKTLKVGMMEYSVTNYVSDRILKDYRFEKVYVNDIAVRLEMISRGNLDLAVIPEPMASTGEQAGLKKIATAEFDEFSPDLLVFTHKALNEKAQSLRVLHEAYDRAVEMIAQNPDKARSALAAKFGLQDEVAASVLLPDYKKVRVPDEAYLQSVLEWNNRTFEMNLNPAHSDLFDTRFAKND